MDFKSAKELLELCRQEHCQISEIMRRRECALGETTRDVVEHRMARALEIMHDSAAQPLKTPAKSMGGLIGGVTGMILAVPAAAILKYLIPKIYRIRFS